MEQEDWQQEDNDPCYDPLDTATDLIKEEIKSEPESPHKTVHDIQFAECWIESEGADILDTESPVKSAAVFICLLCNIGFTSKSQRDRHQSRFCRRRCFNEPLKTTLAYEDPLAKEIPDVFNQSAKLAVLSDSRKRFKCAVCIYSTDKTSNIKKHLVTHTGERRFPCTRCEYKATRKDHLNLHLLSHADVKPFACAVCNFRSVQKHSLTSHMRLHTGEKPYKCTQCDYVGSDSGNLARHVRARHTNVRPFACNQCEYTCVQSGKLTRHMLKHGTDKKFPCSECGYKTNYSRHLRRHEAAKHNG